MGREERWAGRDGEGGRGRAELATDGGWCLLWLGGQDRQRGHLSQRLCTLAFRIALGR